MTAYSSFGPQGFLELKMPKAVHATSLFMQPVITQIADDHNKTQAEVLLKWAVQRGLAIIPKADDVRLQEQNLRVGDGSWRLSDEEMERINGLDMGLRFNDPADVSVLRQGTSAMLTCLRRTSRVATSSRDFVMRSLPASLVV